MKNRSKEFQHSLNYFGGTPKDESFTSGATREHVSIYNLLNEISSMLQFRNSFESESSKNKTFDTNRSLEQSIGLIRRNTDRVKVLLNELRKSRKSLNGVYRDHVDQVIVYLTNLHSQTLLNIQNTVSEMTSSKFNSAGAISENQSFYNTEGVYERRQKPANYERLPVFDADTLTSINYRQQSFDIESQQVDNETSIHLNTRAKIIQGIESTVNEMSALYNHLINIIQVQGEFVQRIDLNINQMRINVERGNKQLRRFYMNINSSINLIITIFVLIGLVAFLYKYLLR